MNRCPLYTVLHVQRCTSNHRLQIDSRFQGKKFDIDDLIEVHRVLNPGDTT